MELPTPTVEQVDIDRLKPWDKNPRVKHDIEGLRGSMRGFGYLDMVIVQKGTYRILHGHGRVTAMKKDGVKRLPVVVADLDDLKADAFTLAVNKLGDNSRFEFSRLCEVVQHLDEANVDLRIVGVSDEEHRKMMEWTPAPLDEEKPKKGGGGGGGGGGGEREMDEDEDEEEGDDDADPGTPESIRATCPKCGEVFDV